MHEKSGYNFSSQFYLDNQAYSLQTTVYSQRGPKMVCFADSISMATSTNLVAAEAALGIPLLLVLILMGYE